MRERTTQTVKASEARQHFSELVNQVFRHEKRVLVEKSGIPVAAIVSTQDLVRLSQLEAAQVERFKVLDATREAFREVSDEELESEVEKAVAEARDEGQKEHAAREVQ